MEIADQIAKDVLNFACGFPGSFRWRETFPINKVVELLAAFATSERRVNNVINLEELFRVDLDAHWWGLVAVGDGILHKRLQEVSMKHRMYSHGLRKIKSKSDWINDSSDTIRTELLKIEFAGGTLGSYILAQ